MTSTFIADLATLVALRLQCPDIAIRNAWMEPLPSTVKAEYPNRALVSGGIRVQIQLDVDALRATLRANIQGNTAKLFLKMMIEMAKAISENPWSADLGHAINSIELRIMSETMEIIEGFLEKNLFKK